MKSGSLIIAYKSAKKYFHLGGAWELHFWHQRQHRPLFASGGKRHRKSAFEPSAGRCGTRPARCGGRGIAPRMLDSCRNCSSQLAMVMAAAYRKPRRQCSKEEGWAAKACGSTARGMVKGIVQMQYAMIVGPTAAARWRTFWSTKRRSLIARIFSWKKFFSHVSTCHKFQQSRVLYHGAQLLVLFERQ